ncbi:uncharacterized protein [Bemisia tabaci]
MIKILRQEAISFLVFMISLFTDATACNHSAVEEIQTIARRLRLYPHVIKTIPSNIVEVTYGGRKLELGGLLHADDLNDPPLVSWPTKEDALYVLVLSGPDASDLDSAQNSYEHWLIGNIPGTDLEKGEKLSEYVGLVKTAYRQGETHRLIFYVFEQPDGKHLQFEGERIKKECAFQILWYDLPMGFGRTLVPYEVIYFPSWFQWPHDKEKLYTFVMTDLDYPTKKTPNGREFLIWLIGNIPGNEGLAGKKCVEYVGWQEAFKQDPDFHRYIVTVFEQPQKLPIDFNSIKYLKSE